MKHAGIVLETMSEKCQQEESGDVQEEQEESRLKILQTAKGTVSTLSFIKPKLFSE